VTGRPRPAPAGRSSMCSSPAGTDGAKNRRVPSTAPDCGDGDLICTGHSPAPFPLLHRALVTAFDAIGPRRPNSWRQPRGACVTAGTAHASSCHRRAAGNCPAPPGCSPGQTRRPNRHANGPQRSSLGRSATLSDTQAQQERASTRLDMHACAVGRWCSQTHAERVFGAFMAEASCVRHNWRE
jgi:hypothetical protein